MVKKPHSEKRWKTGRISIRVHDDLRSALEFLAERDHRALSNYVEMMLVSAVRERIANELSEFGERMDDRPWASRVDVELMRAHARQPAPFRGFPPKKR